MVDCHRHGHILTHPVCPNALAPLQHQVMFFSYYNNNYIDILYCTVKPETVVLLNFGKSHILTKNVDKILALKSASNKTV